MKAPEKVEVVCVPLDPDDCGSVISGYVRYPEIDTNTYGKREQYVEFCATVSLSDCNRWIQWGLSGDDYNLTKIDAAIAALMELRKHMVHAEAIRKKLDIKVKAYNKTLKET